MQTQKMSLANIQGKLSRDEMKNIMAGSGVSCGCTDGTSAGMSYCSTCDKYCTGRGSSQSNTSDCCSG